MRLRITVSKSAADALRRAPEELKSAFVRFGDRGGNLVRSIMVQAIAERQKAGTGQLMNSVTVTRNGNEFTVGPTVDYAQFTNDATRPHDIYPWKAQALAFPMAGGAITRSRSTGHVRTRFTFGGKTVIRGAVFARHVHHPGTRGMHYLEATRDEAEEPLTTLMEEEVENALRRIGGDE